MRMDGIFDTLPRLYKAGIMILSSYSGAAHRCMTVVDLLYNELKQVEF